MSFICSPAFSRPLCASVPLEVRPHVSPPRCSNTHRLHCPARQGLWWPILVVPVTWLVRAPGPGPGCGLEAQITPALWGQLRPEFPDLTWGPRLVLANTRRLPSKPTQRTVEQHGDLGLSRRTRPGQACRRAPTTSGAPGANASGSVVSCSVSPGAGAGVGAPAAAKGPCSPGASVAALGLQRLCPLLAQP